ncbi:MAG TPA: hypothetical protein VFD45_00910 [Patescibacteria group bacterium]|nr:hypothetical protein [Patescibacteria group bacterium]
MDSMSNQEYQKLFTDVIKKQIILLGPDITLAKARNVKGITVADDGSVTAISGNPQEMIQALIDQFVQLSGLIVKKTMEPLLMARGAGITSIPTPQVAAQKQSEAPASPLQDQINQALSSQQNTNT